MAVGEWKKKSRGEKAAFKRQGPYKVQHKKTESRNQTKKNKFLQKGERKTPFQMHERGKGGRLRMGGPKCRGERRR